MFEFQDGVVLVTNLFYTYDGIEWKWADNEDDIKVGRGVSVSTITINNKNPTERNIKFIESLKDKNYEDGLKLLIDRTLKNDEGAWWGNAGLSTDSVSLSHDGLFTIEKTTGLGRYFEYDNVKKIWRWNPGTGEWTSAAAGWFDVPTISYGYSSLESEIKTLVTSLEGKDLYGGAKTIFEISFEGVATEITDRRNIDYGFKSRSQVEVTKIINYVKDTPLPNAGRTCSCGADCESYAKFIVAASAKYNIPDPLLLLSIMMQESSCNKNAGFDKSTASGNSFGLMQINIDNCASSSVYGGGTINYYELPDDKDECKNLLLTNPEKNIEVGAQILYEKYNTFKNGLLFNGCSNKNLKYYNWEAAVRGYNGIGCGKDKNGNPITAQDSFVEEVMTRYEGLSSVPTSLAPVASH